MTTLDLCVYACRVLAIVGAIAVWTLVVVMAGRFCGMNDRGKL